MATEILVRVYKDGTGDYTSFKAAWDANKQNLVANDSYIQFEFSGDLRNTDSFADATGYTTDATRNLRIRAKAGEEATSIAGAGTIYGTNTYIIVLRGRHCEIDGIEIDGYSNVLFQSENTVVKNCLIHDGTSILSIATGATFENCITYNSSTNNIQNANCDRVTQINTLAYSGSISILFRGASGVIGQSVGYNENSQGTGVFFDVANVLNDNNASDDGSAPGATTYTVGQSDFKDYAGGDYDIDSSSPLFALGVGAVLTPSGGGGVTVTVTLGEIDYTSQDAIVSLTGSVDLITTLGEISYSSQNASISLTGNVDVSATLGLIDYESQSATVNLSGSIDVLTTLGSISYSSQNTTVSVTGDVDIIATLGAINYTPNNATISLSSETIINATLGTIDYTSQNTTVTISGLIDITSTLGSIVYNSYPVIVSIGEGQVIGNVTTSFADNIYTAGFKPDTITVSFK